ncbi:MAG: DUF167 domain-containing protein [Kiloniellaceae bacterium]|nr:DUF167 domain-containing protein [Kiloniellaceae bacterium]
MGSDGSPFRAARDGLLVDIRLQPGASRVQVDGLAVLDDGVTVLKVRVTEPPEDGKANAALIKLLAKAWKLPKSSLTLVAGHSDRRKTLAVAGEPAELLCDLQHWLAALD